MIFEFDGVYNYCGKPDNELFAYCRTNVPEDKYTVKGRYIAMHKWVDKDRGLHFKTYKQCHTHFEAIEWLEDRSKL